MTATTDFINDPPGYARHRAINADRRPQANTGADLVLLESGGVKPETAGTTTFLKIQAMYRIQWFQLTPAPNADGPVNVDWSLTRQAGYEPAYYLPWVQNGVVGITLQPSKKVLDDAVWSTFKSQHFSRLSTAERAQLRDRHQQLQNTDPNIFFTAPVNGCSVYVTGPEEAPTVFHANAAGHNPNGSLADATTEAQFWQIFGDKSTHMTQQFTNIQTHAPKQVRTGGPGNWGHAAPSGQSRVVAARDYLDPVGLHPAFDKQLPKKLVQMGLETRTEQWRRWMSELYYGRAEDEEMIDYGNRGCVFGKRVQGRWRFWYQKIFLRQRMNYTTAAVQQSWRVEECRLFWPGAPSIISWAYDWAYGRAV